MQLCLLCLVAPANHAASLLSGLSSCHMFVTVIMNTAHAHLSRQLSDICTKRPCRARLSSQTPTSLQYTAHHGPVQQLGRRAGTLPVSCHRCGCLSNAQARYWPPEITPAAGPMYSALSASGCSWLCMFHTFSRLMLQCFTLSSCALQGVRVQTQQVV